MADTSIEWTDATWNPVAGCTILSPGCTNCYAMRMAARLEAMGTEKYFGLTRKSGNRHVWTGKINLDLPQRRTMPKVGRNEPCPCGSGKKYKNCCGRMA